MPTVAETIVQFLTARGWQEEAVHAGSERDARLTLRGRSGALEIDHRPARNEMWLWLLGPGDKRCLGLPYGNALQPVLAKVVEMQDALSIAGYLGSYMALQTVCPVTIIAWEQFSEQNGPGHDPTAR